MAAIPQPKTRSEAAARPYSSLGLRAYLAELERDHPDWVVHVTPPIDPTRFGVTAVLQQMENRRCFPLVVFDRPLDLHGKPSRFPLVTNIYAARERCALALGLRPEQAYQELGLEYARREERRIPPTLIAPAEAPVKAVVQTGEDLKIPVLVSGSRCVQNTR